MYSSNDDLSDFTTDQSEVTSDNEDNFQNNVNEHGLQLDDLLNRIFQSKLEGRALQLVGSREVIQSWHGRALQLVGSREVIQSWNDLKDLLQQNFCDQRSERCLVQDLMQIRPERGETAYNFGIRCKNLLNLVLTKVKLAENNAQRRQIKIELHNDTVLQTYLRGIAHFGEIGHRVRFRNPENIETAMSYVLEEENFNYFVKQPIQSISKSSNTTTNSTTKTIPGISIQYTATTTQFNQYQNQVTQQPIQQLRPYQASAFNTPQLRPQFSQHGQWRPQTSKPPSFKFAKSPGQLQDRQWSSGQLYHQTDEINASYQEEQQEEYYPTEETQWIEETQQEFEEDNYEHENYTSFMEESEITEEEFEEDNYEHENYTSFMEESEITEEEPISCIKLNTNTCSNLPHIFLPQQEFEEDNYEHENYTSFMEESEITEEEPISCIKLNTNTCSNLPHIFLPEINAKFLVDTGSSRSMVSNEKVNAKFLVDTGSSRSMLIDEVIVPNEDTDTASEAENEEVIETAHLNQTEEPAQSIPSMDEAIDNKNPQHSNQTEEPAQSIPSMDEAIDNKNPQYHFKNTYLKRK
ncbi:hypothetical protein QE152_g4416 [Popillia japonica]|uniref:Uncharacterized protein n=1 Tax=Popillia japonica TaxID=7064 RepID=A0AAW1MVK8_POPJA